MAKAVKGRSKAYPVIDLEEACRLVEYINAKLGAGIFSRELLAEALGYSNVAGGPGARKIAALTQFGLLRRQAGLYEATGLAKELGRNPAHKRVVALQRALHRPPLFRTLLDRYLQQGRVPLQLASILVRDHGITPRASELAARVFVHSSQYAGVLTRDGVLRLQEPAGPPASRSPEAISTGDTSAGHEQRFEFVLSDGKVARLWLPLRLTRKDLDIVRRQVELLEYQVMGESDHE